MKSFYLRGSALFLVLLFIYSASAQTKKGIAVLSYFAGSSSQLDSFDAQKMTHIIYCFGHVQDNKFHLGSAKDTALIQQMVAMKSKNPALKVILSLGGWGGCEPCSGAFATEEGRKEFATSVKELSDYLHSDGIDLDWEYPTIEGFPGHKFGPEDKPNFTALVEQLRKTLGKKAVISFAAGGFTKYLEESVEWDKVMKKVNYVNLMTYDLVNGYATTTGHHTPLYSTPKQIESTDNAVQILLKKGVPAAKMVIGGAFYARVWENVPDTNHGLYQSGHFKGAFDFNRFAANLSTDSGFVLYWDETAKAPYAYNTSKKLFATFDDVQSIQLKTQYAVDHHLGGIMFWELAGDLYTGGMLDAINNTKQKSAGSSSVSRGQSAGQ